MKRPHSISPRFQVERLENRQLLATVYWISNADGFWDDLTNWGDSSGIPINRVPNQMDAVIINRGASNPTITVRSGIHRVASLESHERIAITGGSLEVDNASNVHAGVVLSGKGELSGTGLITLRGESELSGDATFSGAIRNEGTLHITDGHPNISNGTLDNAGAIVHSGGNLDFVFGTPTLNNLAGAVYEVRTIGDTTFLSSISAFDSFNNFGTVRRNGSGTARIDSSLPWNNKSGGNIDVVAGSLQLGSLGTWEGASITVATGASLLFDESAGTFSGVIEGTGAGTVRFGSGSMFVGDDGLTLDFEPGLFQWGGTASIVGGKTVNEGSITISDGQPRLNGGILENVGTIEHVAGQLELYRDTTAALNNLGLYTIDLAEDSMFLVSSGHFNNFGTVRRNGSGTARTDWVLSWNNKSEGNIDVVAGSLQLGSHGTWEGAWITVATGASLLFDESAATFSGVIEGTGAGTVRFGSGSMFVGDDGLTLDFEPGLFQWGGTASIVGGTTVNEGSITISDGQPRLNGGILDNAGTIEHVAGQLDLAGLAGTLNNLPDGLYDVKMSGNAAFATGLSSNRFNNAGTLRRNGAAAVRLDIPFSNTGLVEVRSGELLFNASVAQLSGAVLTAGSWDVYDGVLRFNTPSITTNQANITVRGTGSFPALAGLARNDGSLKLLGGAHLSRTGDFRNSGSLVLGVGYLLTIGGNYTQASETTFEFGGNSASGLFGRMIIHGNASLAGTARFAFANGFTPERGDSYNLMTFAAHSGSLTFEGLFDGAMKIFDAVLEETVLRVTSLAQAANLAVVAISPPPPAVIGQNVEFSYRVDNLAPHSTLAEEWIDSAYLSLDDKLDATDSLIATINHAGALAAGGAYTEQVTAVIPAVQPGNYHIIVGNRSAI